MSTPAIAAAQAGIVQLLSTVFSSFLAPPSITLSGPIFVPPIGYNNASTQSIISGGINRTYSVNIPNDYASRLQKSWPLIIDYHGHSDYSHDQWDNSQYWNYAGGQEYIVAYPQGVNQSWQGPSYATKGVNDLQFTSDLLMHLKSSYNVDPDRIYASGKSNGGGFVNLLACSDNGDEFAAFAMSSAALYQVLSPSACSKKRAIMESHGLLDNVIPYNGGNGSGGQIPSITDWVSWWGERDCGDSVEATVTESDGYNITTYVCDGPISLVHHYKVFNLGHCWPSVSGDNFDAIRDTTLCGDKALDYTPAVLNFFGKWNLTNAPQN